MIETKYECKTLYVSYLLYTLGKNPGGHPYIPCHIQLILRSLPVLVM